MSNEDLEAIEKEIAKRKATGAVVAVDENSSTALAELNFNDVGAAIGDVKQKIVQGARDIVHDDKSIKKHSETIAAISDRALEVEEEKQRLIVEQVNADNKVIEQEIKNRLIVLKAEAKRLREEQKQLDKDQKAEYKARNKAAKWELYKDKLEKMKYTYVPNALILTMLLFFDGVVSFFNGLGAVSTAIVKALKWVFILAAVVVVLMVIPVTREWLLSVLQFK